MNSVRKVVWGSFRGLLREKVAELGFICENDENTREMGEGHSRGFWCQFGGVYAGENDRLFCAVPSHSLLHISSPLFNIKREEEGCRTPRTPSTSRTEVAETIFPKNDVRGLWRDFLASSFGIGFRPPAASFGTLPVLECPEPQNLLEGALAITTLGRRENVRKGRFRAKQRVLARESESSSENPSFSECQSSAVWRWRPVLSWGGLASGAGGRWRVVAGGGGR